MLFHWRTLIPIVFGSFKRKPYRKAQPGSRRRKNTSLHLEELESRWLPSTITNNLSGALTLDLQGDTVNISGNSTNLVIFDSTGAIAVTGSTYSFTNSPTNTVVFSDVFSTPLATLTIDDSSGTGTAERTLWHGPELE